MPQFVDPITANIEHHPLDPIYLGRRADVDEVRYYEGMMDELRISDSPRSGDWIQIEFNNQSDPSTFLSLDSRESCELPVPSGGTASAAESFILSKSSTTITLSGQTEGSITWQESVDGENFSDVAGGSEQGTASYTTPGLTKDTYYRALITNTGGCTAAEITSTVAAVNIVPAYGIEDYSRRKRIIIKHEEVCGNTELVDFPILLTASDPDLRNVANEGGMSHPSGYDITFTLKDGTTRLDHDLESYDAEAGTLTIWVRMPSLSYANNTEIYLYYGNPAVTEDQSMATIWKAGYAGYGVSKPGAGGCDQLCSTWRRCRRGLGCWGPDRRCTTL